MRIAISGHRGLTADVEHLVDNALRTELAQHTAHTGLTGISCLADGTDQLFARAVLDLGGDLEVVIPAVEYRDGLPVRCHATYDSLLTNASSVYRLDYIESNSEAHMAASQYMLNSADHLFAVWDGKPARGHGGTADVVHHAHAHGLPVTVIWPDGAHR